MQLVAVDEPAGCDVADLGVVLPAVPQPPDHLDVVGGLGEQVRCQLRSRRRGCGGRSARPRPARPETLTRTPARPELTQSSVAIALETWNGSVCVTVTVGISPMRLVSGATLAAIRIGVQAAAHLVGAPVGPRRLVTAG